MNKYGGLYIMKFTLSSIEQEIMNLFWNTNHMLSGADVWEYFNEIGKEHKRQTINTYLTRMSEKGLLIKKGRKYYYQYNKEQLEHLKAKMILDTLYDGSLEKFICALSSGDDLDKNDIAEMTAYLDNKEH